MKYLVSFYRSNYFSVSCEYSIQTIVKTKSTISKQELRKECRKLKSKGNDTNRRCSFCKQMCFQQTPTTNYIPRRFAGGQKVKTRSVVSFTQMYVQQTPSTVHNKACGSCGHTYVTLLREFSRR